MASLIATKLSKRFGPTVALDDVDLRLEDGESAALLGPSGCGKTTLLRVLTGLDAPESGFVAIDGETLTGPGVYVPPEKRRIGMVFQDWAVFPHLTVSANVAYGLTRAEIASGRIQETLDLVDLSGLAERFPDELSGGQLQRVAVARALAPRPRILLFDEPFSNLDSELRIRVRAEIAALMRELGMTSLFVTHDQEEAFVLGNRVIIMRGGRVQQEGPPAVVYEQPSTAWVATFVGDANLVDGVAEGGTVTTVLGALRLATDARGPRRVLVRPEHLMIGNGDDGVVADVEFYGHDTSYRVEVGSASLLVRGMAAPRFRPGDLVSLTYVGPDVVSFPVGEVDRLEIGARV